MVVNLDKLKDFFTEAVSTCKSIALLTHQNPDGDGFAACLALQEYLKYNSKNTDIVLEETAPDTYDYLNGKDRSIVFNHNLKYDLVIILDCHEKERVGICAPLIENAQKVIAIDHHHMKKDIEGSITYIDTNATSAGTILYQLLLEEVKTITHESRTYFASAIYTTILNDTDNFVNRNTNDATFSICEGLCKLGLIPGEVSQKFVMGKTPSELKFTGEVFSTIEIIENGTVLFVDSTIEMLKKLNLTHHATSKMTRWFKGTKGVKVVVYYREVEENLYRLSLRSDYIDVNKIARVYGGGGHTAASGCEISGTLKSVKEKILRMIKEQM